MKSHKAARQIKAVWRDCWRRARQADDVWGSIDEAIRDLPRNLDLNFKHSAARFRRRNRPSVQRALCLALYSRERPEETDLECALRRYHGQRMAEDL